MPKAVKNNPPVQVLYTNHRGETRLREIKPVILFYGKALPYHPEAQWLLQCYDVEKEGYRTYALSNCDFRSLGTELLVGSEVPEHLRELMLIIVRAHDMGRAWAISPEDAVQLREHGLITHVNQPTERGEELVKGMRREMMA